MEKSVFDNGFFEFLEAEEEFLIHGEKRKEKWLEDLQEYVL